MRKRSCRTSSPRRPMSRYWSASPQSVELSASAIKIGNDIEITASPGEVFSNLTNTIKEKAGVITMPLAQANDALGYMPQSFEMSPVGQQGLGFFAGVLLDGLFREAGEGLFVTLKSGQP